MQVEIKLCDLCERPLQGPGVLYKIKHGVVVTFGYALGGWGSRHNDVDWSGEVCETCYAEYKKIALAVGAWLEKRKGVRAPEIICREHHVSIVSDDEPSPDGHKTPLLR